MNPDLLLLGAGLLGGAMNALAGGGSFVTLPALIAAGVPSVAANASSTLALYPGGVASAWVYRKGLTTVAGVPLRPAFIASLVGGLLGALLLLWTPGAVFDHILPWLLLAATLTLAFAPRLGPILRRRVRLGVATLLTIQFVLGIYGGYFGGAVGLMMISAWSLLDTADLRALNPARTLMVTAANTVAVLCFILAGAIRWPEALAVAMGAVAGGSGGAWLGKRLPAPLIRAVTLLLAAGITIAFFVRAFAKAH